MLLRESEGVRGVQCRVAGIGGGAGGGAGTGVVVGERGGAGVDADGRCECGHRYGHIVVQGVLRVEGGIVV